MVQIILCDSEQDRSRLLQDALSKFFFQIEDCQITACKTGEELLRLLMEGTNPDLVFLDVQMQPENGIQLANILRLRHFQTELILCSDNAEDAIEGYRLHAFDFLQKPFSLLRLKKIMNRFVREKLQKNIPFLQVPVRGFPVRINLHQVWYFESQERKILVHGTSEPLSFYQKLDQLQETLADSSFIRCHQSYLVNAEMIQSMQNSSLLLKNGKTLPVSRRYYQDVRAALRQIHE